MPDLVTPQPLHPFAITGPAVTNPQDVDAPIPVTGMKTRQFVETVTQVQFVENCLATMSLR